MKNIQEKIFEARQKKVKQIPIYRVIRTHSPLYGGDEREYKCEGTLKELIEYFSYTLEVGKSWENEKGNKKINMNPKNIQALITNLERAKNNAARNGYSGDSFTYEEIGTVPENEIETREEK